MRDYYINSCDINRFDSRVTWSVDKVKSCDVVMEDKDSDTNR